MSERVSPGSGLLVDKDTKLILIQVTVSEAERDKLKADAASQGYMRVDVYLRSLAGLNPNIVDGFVLRK